MRIYIDTSVIGGCFDEEFQQWSNELFDEFKKGIETYIVEGALTNKSYNDALHIALGTIYNADVLASWNFKHIVNLERIRLYNSINLRLGYRIIEIRTPREILKSKDNEKE
ncbi:MAG: hypothetical protein AABZ32_06590 [Bacteroidota bacterium]